MAEKSKNYQVSILATSDTFISSLMSFYDALHISKEVAGAKLPFELEIVSKDDMLRVGLTGITIKPDRTIDTIAKTDIVIIPISSFGKEQVITSQYLEEVEWLKQMHSRGAVLCAACSGAVLLAQTGLLDGREATTHWVLEQTFREHFPKVHLRLDRELVVSKDETLALSGAASAWQDLALYLISRYSGPATANMVSKFFMLPWHSEGQKPFMAFHERLSHGDRAILAAQNWFQSHWRDANSMKGMILQSGLSTRNFAKRFRKATGFTPISYIQHMRVEKAKHLIESTNLSLDQISYEIGYEDPSFFRRIFKRIVGVKPIDYRQKFGLR